MDIVRTIVDLRSQIAGWRKSAERVGLVPTMGALHEGHLALVRAAQTECGRVVATIFVNPRQFGPNEDFSRYPRNFEGDCAMMREVPVDVLFAPEPDMMYPRGSQTW